MSNVLLEELRAKAKALTNGDRGNVDRLGEITASMAVVLCDLAEHGCAVQCRPRFGWPAAVTVVGIVATLAGLALKLLGNA